MQKNIAKIIVCALIMILVILVMIVFISLVLKNRTHKVLTKKFYIPIEEQYEIVFFESEGILPINKYCNAEIKVNENEYAIIKSEMEKAGYTSESIDDFDYSIYFENNSYWMDSENIVEVYTNFATERWFFMPCLRISMDIFITESDNGYRSIYMSRN